MTRPAGSLEALVLRFPAVPWVAPFLVFIVLTALQSAFPGGILWIYPLKTVLVAALVVVLLPWLPKLRPAHTWTSVALGVVVFVLWIAPEGLYPLLGEATIFDPFAEIGGAGAWVWIGVRLFGATVVVGIAEELFWRGFLLRWLVDADFEKVPLGTFTWASFLITSVLFAVEHDRWLVGLAAGIAYNLWIYRTKSLYACIVAHAVTNLALGVYVLVTGEWTFW